MSSDIVDVATLFARGYSRSGQLPGGRLSRLYFWPWATIVAVIGAAGLFAGSMLTMYRTAELFLLHVAHSAL